MSNNKNNTFNAGDVVCVQLPSDPKECGWTNGKSTYTGYNGIVLIMEECDFTYTSFDYKIKILGTKKQRDQFFVRTNWITHKLSNGGNNEVKWIKCK
jgi:hypothetical protein